MFKKLRDKLTGWAKKFSEEEKEEPEEPEKIEEKEEKSKRKEKPSKEQEPEEPEKIEEKEETEKKESKKEKKKQKEEKRKQKQEEKQRRKEEKEKSKEKKEDKEESPEKAEAEEKGEGKKEKEIPVPTKFEVGKQKVEPDTEKLQEIGEELKEEEPEERESKEEDQESFEHSEEKEKTEEAEKKPEKYEEKETNEEEKPEKKKSGFFKFGKTTISEEDFEKYSEELETSLLENNVAFDVVEKILEQLKEKIVGQEFSKKEIENKIKEALREVIYEVLIEPYDLIQEVENKTKSNSEDGNSSEPQEKEPYVMLFCGINGTGKTTSIAKMAHHLNQQGLSCVMAAADTFRAASIEQIQEHANNLNVKAVTHEYGSDPAAVGFDAIKYAKKNNIDCVLIDTAGRMHTEKNLLQEMEKISRVCRPDVKLFVGESITGNDAIEQARSFNESIGIDGSILAKADVDEKAGTVLSVGYVTGKPILYLGVGQEYKDLEPFDKEKFIERIGL